MRPNNAIDLDDLFGTKPPAPPASSGVADDLPPPPYEGPTNTVQGYEAPQYGQQQQAPQPQSYAPSIPYGGNPWPSPPPQQPPSAPFPGQVQAYQNHNIPQQPPQQPFGNAQGYSGAVNVSPYAAPYTSPYPTGMGSAPQPQPMPTQPSPIATPGPAAGQSTVAPIASAEDDDRVQLEKIIRLRRELEQEQEREREKREALQTWGCPQCTYRNALQVGVCAMCGVTRPGYTAPTTASGAAQTAKAPSPPVTAPPRLAGATAWQCGICLAPNEADAARCRVCQAYQANGTPIATTGPSSGAGGTATATSSASSPWMCSVCGKVNPPTAANCSVCHGYQRNGVPVPASTPMKAGAATSGSSAGAAVTCWSCPVCTFDNPVTAAVCAACRTGKRPAHMASANSKTDGVSREGDEQKKTWPCPTCTFINKMRRSKCDMCGTVRPAQYAHEKAAADKGEKKREEQSDDDEVQWQDDNVAKACNRCHQDFGLMRRRHHCRKCGYVFCATCSPFYIPNKRTFVPERACVNCYEATKGKK